MKYEVIPSNQFKKDLRLAQKRGHNLEKLKAVIKLLADDIPLDAKYRDHSLTGNYDGFRECHIEPDWLLIYKVEDDILILKLIRTGTHSDLF